MGQTESKCQVIVQSNDMKKVFHQHRSLPVFIQSLKDKTIQEGEKLFLQIRINGEPKPQVIWYKDHQLLKNTYDCQVN